MSLDLAHLKRLAVSTLDRLVNDEGIYASTAKGYQGRYHGFFGRDSLITAAFIHETEKATHDYQFIPMAINSILRLSEWQGQKNDHETREAIGKIPHEIREKPTDYEPLTIGYKQQGRAPFYVDPNDHIMKNWDSNDATPLWIIIIARLIQDKRIIENESIYVRLEKALRWCLKNIDEFGGLAGYDYNPQATYFELPHQSWKDNQHAYLHHDGRQPTMPIHDVAVNAWMWAACKYGAELFKHRNESLANDLTSKAKSLKDRFNREEDGFLMRESHSGYYFAEAIDGKGHQLHGVCSDPALALWGYYADECIIENEYIPKVIQRIMAPDMFDPDAGLHTYSTQTQALSPHQYHRGPYTFWPFLSGLIGIGASHFGYTTEAKQILTAMLTGVSSFDSCVELFIKEPEKPARLFSDEETGFTSSLDQAWTAGAVYYATEALPSKQV